MKVVVDNRLRCQYPPADLAARLREEFTRVNPQHMKLKSMGYKAWNEPYELKAWKDDSPGVLSIPRGAAAKLVDIAKQLAVPLSFEDRRAQGKPHNFPDLMLTPRDYQIEISDSIASKENLIVRAGAGAGKTVAAMLFVTRAKRTTLVVVHSNALRKQWLERIESDMGIRARSVGTIQGAKQDLRPITVGMAQSLAKLDERRWKQVNEYFGVLVQDEVHIAGASSFNSVIDRSAARYRIGISDSERRKDGRTFLVYDQFGDVHYEIEHEKLAAAGHVLDVEVRVKVASSPDVSWYQNAYGEEDGKVDSQAFNRLISEICGDERRNDLVARTIAALATKYVVLVFSHRVEHCRLLSAMLAGLGVRSGLLLGGAENAGEFECTVKELKGGLLNVGIGTVQALGTGIDIPNASRGVVATPLGFNKQLWRQVRGRLCRPAPGKSDSIIYYFHDPSAFGDRPLRNLRAWNQTVNVCEGNHLVEVGDYIRSQGEPRPFLSELPEWPE